MAAVGVVGVFVAWIAIMIGYQSWLRSSVKPREFVTQLPVDEVKRLFAQKVAGMGWKIIDDDNPMVAQSSLIAGIRQAISMKVTPVGDHLRVQVWVSRQATKGIAQVPYKAHTIRMRMNAFERAASAGGGNRPAAGPALTTTPTAPAAPTVLPATAMVPTSVPVAPRHGQGKGAPAGASNLAHLPPPPVVSCPTPMPLQFPPAIATPPPPVQGWVPQVATTPVAPPVVPVAPRGETASSSDGADPVPWWQS